MKFVRFLKKRKNKELKKILSQEQNFKNFEPAQESNFDILSLKNEFNKFYLDAEIYSSLYENNDLHSPCSAWYPPNPRFFEFTLNVIRLSYKFNYQFFQKPIHEGIEPPFNIEKLSVTFAKAILSDELQKKKSLGNPFKLFETKTFEFTPGIYIKIFLDNKTIYLFNKHYDISYDIMLIIATDENLKKQKIFNLKRDFFFKANYITHSTYFFNNTTKAANNSNYYYQRPTSPIYTETYIVKQGDTYTSTSYTGPTFFKVDSRTGYRDIDYFNNYVDYFFTFIHPHLFGKTCFGSFAYYLEHPKF